MRYKLEILRIGLSTRSFQILSQWLCLGRVVFGESIPEEAIVRLADMCGVSGMDPRVAGHMKKFIIANFFPQISSRRDPDTNTYCLISQPIIWE